MFTRGLNEHISGGLLKPRVRFGLSSSTSVLAWKRFLVKPDFTVEKGPIPAFLPL